MITLGPRNAPERTDDPPGTMRMSLKGNDLMRKYLWTAALSAVQYNPPARARYKRQRAQGKRGDVAFAIHCPERRTSGNWVLDPVPLMPRAEEQQAAAE